MRWHAQKIRCNGALVLRGYRRGSYAAQSPYNALLTVLTHRGKKEIQGMLSDTPLSRKDFHQLVKVCVRHGIRLVSTRRHGRTVTIRQATADSESFSRSS